jgi:hypothetical protein
MDVTPPEPVVAVFDALPALGFVTDPTWPGALVLKVGHLELQALKSMNRFFHPNVQIGGIASTQRTLRNIEFEMPRKVESVDQIVAWITFGIGVDFKPSEPIPWFEAGKALQHLLPWRQALRRMQADADAHRVLRAARPHCQIGRDWMRLLNKNLRLAAETCPENAEFAVSCNGQILKIYFCDVMHCAPVVRGTPWTNTYLGRVRDFRELPRRLMTDPVDVGVWNGNLEVERSRLAITLDGEPQFGSTAPITE